MIHLQILATVVDGFAILPSFDQINLGASYVQASVLVGFAITIIGVHRVNRRPAMEALAAYWMCIGIAALVNIASSSAGAFWQNRPLSLALTTIVVALHGAAVPFVRLASMRLAGVDNANDSGWPLASRRSLVWALTVLVLHGGGVVLGLSYGPDARAALIAWSRGLDLFVMLAPAWFAWQAVSASAPQHRAMRAVAWSASMFATRGALDFVLGLRVGSPNMAAFFVFMTILLSVLLVLMSGVFALLATASEEEVQLQQHAEQLREHQARLARSERLESVGRLASGVAHDFANVLQVIELSAEHMRSTGRASRPEDVDDILAASRRGRDLARQLLALGRPVEDRVRVFDLAEHVAELKPMLARLAAGRDLQIELTTASLPVRLDPSHADQLLINLVVNAAQATNDGGQIVLSCAADAHDGPRRACLSVRDNGQGIPADVLPHIFEPFYTTKSRDTGTGLGLSTVWSIVQQSGGDVDVESRVAVGTRFAVTLPLAELPRA